MGTNEDSGTELAAWKDPAIKNVVIRIRDRLGPDAFRIVDHWEIDPYAIGLANPRNPGILAYISTAGEQEGRYYVELELPPSIGENTTYRFAGRDDDLDFEELVSIVSSHLARSDSAAWPDETAGQALPYEP